MSGALIDKELLLGRTLKRDTSIDWGEMEDHTPRPRVFTISSEGSTEDVVTTQHLVTTEELDPKSANGFCNTHLVVASKILQCLVYMIISTLFWSVTIVTLGDSLTKAKKHFDAPYFTSWARTSFLVLLHPISFVLQLIWNTVHQETFNGPREKFLFPIDCRLTVQSIAKLSVLQLVIEYSLCQSLRQINPTVVIIILSSYPAFRYILFWIVLEHKAEPTKIVSALLCIIGIVVMSHSAYSYTNPMFLGVILAAFSSAISAIHETYFRYLHPVSTFTQRSFMYFCTGGLNFVVGILLFAFIFAFELEKLDFNNVPWLRIIVSALMTDGTLFTFNLVYNILPVNILPIKYALAPTITLAWEQFHSTKPGMKLNTFQILAIIAILSSQICWIVPSLCHIQKKRRKKKSHSVKNLVIHAVEVRKQPNFL